MGRYVHITYSGIGGMSEAVFTLLASAVGDEPQSHHLFFYGKDELDVRHKRRCDDLGVPFQYFKKSGKLGPSSLFQMFEHLVRLKPSTVVTHMTQPLPALFAYRLANPRAKIFVVEHHSNQLKTSQDWILSLLNHWICHHTVYLTEEYRDQVKKKLKALLRLNHVSVIGNGIDTERFAPLADSRQPTGVIGMQARMVDGKDFETLLTAFEILNNQRPELRLELAGDGPNRSHLEDLAKRLHIETKVRFLGMLEQDELIRHMLGWEALILSTSGETMSRSIMEGQALGLAVVASDVAGIRATIEDGRNGLLFAAKDPDSLAQKISLALDNKTTASQIRQNARQSAETQFSAKSSWQTFSRLISESFARK